MPVAFDVLYDVPVAAVVVQFRAGLSASGAVQLDNLLAEARFEVAGAVTAMCTGVSASAVVIRPWRS